MSVAERQRTHSAKKPLPLKSIRDPTLAKTVGARTLRLRAGA
jgi:hypothetical protein